MPIAQEKTYWICITASKPHGVLYIGMTSDLAGAHLGAPRACDGWLHQALGVGRLVYFEAHDDAATAAKRERAMKRWRREWKIQLIEKDNPTWRDLFGDVVRVDGFEW